jgi:mannose-6-phosphate isomerase-like protein (cupin superfamily)
MFTHYADIPPYQSLDGSQIRELMHPDEHPVERMSLAEATVLAGEATLLHRHRTSEEIYHFLAGRGLMIRGDQCFDVGCGDTVLIPPGTPHRVANDGAEPLRFLCACSPAYRHEDTELLSGTDGR